MDFAEFAWLDRGLEVFAWLIAAATSGVRRIWQLGVELQAAYPQLLSFQTLFGLIGTALGIWKWWESREVRLFKRFESMIEGQEAQLVKARSDLLDVLNRPGPGLLVRPPLFTEKALRYVLARHRWHTAFSSVAIAGAIDRKLESAIRTCDRKVGARPDNPKRTKAAPRRAACSVDHAELVAAVIGHEAGGKETRTLVRHYVRSDLLERKAQVLRSWDEWLQSVVSGGVVSKVIPFQKAG